MGAGGYRLRIKGRGDAKYRRPDVPEISLSEKTYPTFILTGTSSGLLVNSHSLRDMPNSQARVRRRQRGAKRYAQGALRPTR